MSDFDIYSAAGGRHLSLFPDTIHLQEAKASSEIENILTTNDDQYKSIVADTQFDNAAAKEVIRYKEALWYGLELLKSRPFIKVKIPQVDSKDLIEILFWLPYTRCQFLIDANMGTPTTVGNYLISLENEGFLTASKVGTGKLYLNYRLMNIFENKWRGGLI